MSGHQQGQGPAVVPPDAIVLPGSQVFSKWVYVTAELAAAWLDRNLPENRRRMPALVDRFVRKTMPSLKESAGAASLRAIAYRKFQRLLASHVSGEPLAKLYECQEDLFPLPADTTPADKAA